MTEAIKLAVAAELKRKELTLRDKLKALQDEVAFYAATGLEADKAFYDWLGD